MYITRALLLAMLSAATLVVGSAAVRADTCSKTCQCGPTVSCSGTSTCTTDANSCTGISIENIIHGDGTTETITTTDKKTCQQCGTGGNGQDGGGGDGGICSEYPPACQIRNTPTLPGVAVEDLYVGH
jgi:hypothetical protein